jgi:hypothetical protein
VGFDKNIIVWIDDIPKNNEKNSQQLVGSKAIGCAADEHEDGSAVGQRVQLAAQLDGHQVQGHLTWSGLRMGSPATSQVSTSSSSSTTSKATPLPSLSSVPTKKWERKTLRFEKSTRSGSLKSQTSSKI